MTEERIFIQYIWFGTKLRSYDLENIEQITLRKISQEYGSILINYDTSWFNKIMIIGIESRWSGQSRRLEYISDFKSVFELINNRH